MSSQSSGRAASIVPIFLRLQAGPGSGQGRTNFLGDVPCDALDDRNLCAEETVYVANVGPGSCPSFPFHVAAKEYREAVRTVTCVHLSVAWYACTPVTSIIEGAFAGPYRLIAVRDYVVNEIPALALPRRSVEFKRRNIQATWLRSQPEGPMAELPR
jgi:hypothetical protein